MIFADWHPDDERILARYLDASEADPTLDRHLGACGACARRLATLTRTLEAVHGAGSELADEVFDRTRLARQREAVLSRLGASPRGRILPFPPAFAPAWRPTRVPRAIRTVAAAVVLIAVAGIGAGQFQRSLWRPSAPASAEAVQPVAASALSRATPPDESIFSDIDFALAQPRTAELRVLDELTPHVRDAVAPIR